MSWRRLTKFGYKLETGIVSDKLSGEGEQASEQARDQVDDVAHDTETNVDENASASTALESSVSETDASVSQSTTDSAPASKSAPVVAIPSVAPAPAKAGGVVTAVVAWLSLLLIVALAAAAFWFFQQQSWRERDVGRKIDDLASAQQALSEARLKREEMLNSQEQRLRELLREEVELAEGRMGERQQQFLDRMDRQAAEQRQAAGQEIERQRVAVEQALNTQREELARFNIGDRQQWLIAEAQYLLRLANQRMLMAGDVEAATALLTSADEIARQLENIDFLPVRSAVADDLAALREVEQIDTEGLYLRLSALIDRVSQLQAFAMPERDKSAAKAEAVTWQERLKQGYQAALTKLSEYIVIQRRDVPYSALMDPQWEGLVRQNLRMLLEQAQVALLMGNQPLYEESLRRASRWVSEFFDADAEAAKALAAALEELAGETVSVQLPDISSSLRALDTVIAKRQREG